MSDGGARSDNGNGDPLLVRRFVLHPDEVDDASEPAHTWPAPPHHVPAHRADSPRPHEPTAIESDEPTAAGPHTPEPTAAGPRGPEPTAPGLHTIEPTTAGPRGPEPTAPGLHTTEPTTAGPPGPEPAAIASGGRGGPVHAGSYDLEPTSMGRGSIAVVLSGITANDRAGGPSRRRVLLIAGLVVLVAIALAAAGIGVINGGNEGPRALPAASAPGAPNASAPGTASAAPGETTPGGTPTAPGAPGQPGEQGPAQPGEQVPGQGRAGLGSGTTTGPGGLGALDTAAFEISRTTLAQTAGSSPPEEPRTGAIRTEDNRCLALPGGKPRGHNKYALVTTCDGPDGQTWTLDPDGTVRLGGKCALAEGTTIRISGCGNRREAQWRTGPDGILLNVSTGRCLTDRGDAVLAECTGAPNQRWALP